MVTGPNQKIGERFGKYIVVVNLGGSHLIRYNMGAQPPTLWVRDFLTSDPESWRLINMDILTY